MLGEVIAKQYGFGPYPRIKQFGMFHNRYNGPSLTGKRGLDNIISPNTTFCCTEVRGTSSKYIYLKWQGGFGRISITDGLSAPVGEYHTIPVVWGGSLIVGSGKDLVILDEESLTEIARKSHAHMISQPIQSGNNLYYFSGDMLNCLDLQNSVQLLDKRIPNYAKEVLCVFGTSLIYKDLDNLVEIINLSTLESVPLWKFCLDWQCSMVESEGTLLFTYDKYICKFDLERRCFSGCYASAKGRPVTITKYKDEAIFIINNYPAVAEGHMYLMKFDGNSTDLAGDLMTDYVRWCGPVRAITQGNGRLYFISNGKLHDFDLDFRSKVRREDYCDL